MGLCLCAPEHQEAKPVPPFDASNIFIGDTGRFNKVEPDKLKEIEPERRAMTAMELLAETETVYRRDKIVFSKLKGFDFNADPKAHFLRTVLDEPLGRFYLTDFCKNKDNYKPIAVFVKVWTDIFLLDRVEVTIEDVLAIVKKEEDITNGKQNVERDRDSESGTRNFIMKGPSMAMQTAARVSGKISLSLGRNNVRSVKSKRSTGNVVDDEKNRANIDEFGESMLVNEDDTTLFEKQRRQTERFRSRRRENKGTRFTTSMIDDEHLQSLSEESIFIAAGMKERDAEDTKSVIELAKQVVNKYLSPDSSELLDSRCVLSLRNASKSGSLEMFVKDFEQVVGKCFEAASKQIEELDAMSLRKTTFVDLQLLIFQVMMMFNLGEEFKLHSEYKRYLKKYKFVYNFICHKDFDYMNTLGKGSFGRVIRVRKKTNGRQYALKVMSKKKILSGAEVAEQATIEKEVLVICFTCPFIVCLHFAFQTTRALFIALDLLEGGTLTDVMHRFDEKKFTIEAARTVAAQIIIGLNHLHLHGILYRDLKPMNVLMDSRGNAILTDMGLCAKYKISVFDDTSYADEPEAEVANSELLMPIHKDLIDVQAIKSIYQDKSKRMSLLKKSELKCVGTPSFRAPELLAITSSSEARRHKNNRRFRPNREGYGHEVDYWALGITLYFMVTGMYPFRNRNKFNIFGPSPDHRANEISEQKSLVDLKQEFGGKDAHFMSLLEGLLNKDPNQRLGHDINVIQNHPFFVSFDYENKKYFSDEFKPDAAHVKSIWERIHSGEIKPVYKPKIKSRRTDEKPRFQGLGDAMKQFAQENVLELFGGGENDIIDDFKKIRAKHQKVFEEWNFIPGDLLKDDWDLLERYFGDKNTSLI